MKQLTGLDASFLYMETPNSFGHVSSLSVYRRPEDPDYRPFEALRERVQAALPRLEPFRRRLVEVPFEIDHPYWVADPGFDLEFHLRHQGVAPPGTEEQLADQVARIIGRPMDRSRPLWEIYVIEGLANGNFAVLIKVHHATIDGASGVELLTVLLSAQPDPEGRDVVVDDWEPGRIPGQLEMFNRALLSLARQPEKAIRLQLSTLRRLGGMSKNLSDATKRARLSGVGAGAMLDRAPVLPSLAAPRTPFNRAITAHRRCAFRSVPLQAVRSLKTHFEVTVNDIVMAVCAGALRNYLAAKQALPDKPLIAMVPVSIRTGEEADRWTNRVSGLVVALPTHLAQPQERVQAMHEAMAAAKADFELVPAEALIELSQLAPPALSTRAARMAASLRIANLMAPPINLVISNVPGPRAPLYLGEARLEHYYPLSTVVDGQGLNITVQSYVDSLDFGLVACRELVPDLVELLDLCVAEVDVLLAAASLAPLEAKVSDATDHPLPSQPPRSGAKPATRPPRPRGRARPE